MHVIYALVYTLVGVGLLALGWLLLDLLTPGRLSDPVWKPGQTKLGACIVAAAGSLSVGLIAFTTIWVNADSGFGWVLLWTVVWGVIGVALQSLAFVILDWLTPGKLGEIICGETTGEVVVQVTQNVELDIEPVRVTYNWYPALVVAGFQLAVAGVVVASVA